MKLVSNNPKPQKVYRNPMNMQKLSVGLVSTMHMLDTEPYGKDLTDEKLGQYLWNNITGVGGEVNEDPDDDWNAANLNALRRGAERILRALETVPMPKDTDYRCDGIGLKPSAQEDGLRPVAKRV